MKLHLLLLPFFRTSLGQIFFSVLMMSNISPAWAQTQLGEASYYNDRYHLKNATASGELYDRYKYTAAHRTLPFGTWVRVTNLSNSRSVRVRINDRGPSIQSRIIDLSYAAADQIGLIQSGIARVEVEVVSTPAPPSNDVIQDPAPLPRPSPIAEDLPLVDALGRPTNSPEEKTGSSSPQGEESPLSREAESYTPALFRMIAFKSEQQGYAIQVGAYFSFYRLLEAMDELSQKNLQNTLVQSSTKDGKPVFRILVGPFKSRNEAEQARQKLSRKGVKGITMNLRDLN